MRFWSVLSLVLCCGYGVSHAATPTDYLLNADHDVLSAIVDGKKQVVSKDDGLLSIVKVADFDHDGGKDVLFYSSSGGNCCPNTYALASYQAGQFVVEELADSWSDPTFAEQDGQSVLTFMSDNEGINDDDYEATMRSFTVKAGKPVLLEERKDQEIPAVAEYRSKQFSQELKDSSDTVSLLQYDLDDDGKPDIINGSYWSRWGRILVENIQFSTGKALELSEVNCKRIGVLETSHNGMKDLVCDASAQYHWDGKTYQAQPNPFKPQE